MEFFGKNSHSKISLMISLTPVIVIFVVVFCCLMEILNAAHILSISPNTGSLEGGTLLTIHGASFSNSHDENANLVFIGGIPCKVERYYSSANQLKCITPPHSTPGPQMIRILVDSRVIATCAMNPCQYTYSEPQTPVITSVSPHVSIPGSEISIQGRIIQNQPLFFTIFVGDFLCQPNDELIENSEAISLRSQFLPDPGIFSSSNGWGSVPCKAVKNQAGYYIPKMNVVDRGDARIYQRSLLTNIHGEQYMFQTIPTIDDIFPREGSLEGGTIVKIHGKGFSSTVQNNHVDIDGVPCLVQSSSFEEITCVTQKSSYLHGRKKYRGNRGINREWWLDVSGHRVADLTSDSRFPDSPSGSEIMTVSFESPQNWADFYGQRFQTFFKAPVSANYTFYLASDDHAALYLSEDEHPENKSLIVYNTYSNNRNFFHNDGQSSGSIFLDGGVYYFMEVLHKEHAGADHVSVAVRYTHEKHTRNSFPEVQRLITRSSVVRETFTLTFIGYDGGRFKLYYESSSTDWIPYDASATVVQNEIRSMSGARSASVSKSSISSGIQYTILFNTATLSPRANLILERDFLSPIQGASSSSHIVRAALPSEPIRGSYTVSFRGKSVVVPYNADANRLLNLLESHLDLGFVSISGISGNVNDGIIFDIHFSPLLGDIESLQVNGSMLTGTNATVEVLEIRNGSSDQFLSPIPCDLLFTVESHPQVHVKSNNIESVCLSNRSCSFSFNENATPKILQVVPSIVSHGSIIQIDGSGFDLALSNNTVTIGDDSKCEVVESSNSLLKCVVGDISADSNIVKVNVKGKGIAKGTFFISSELKVRDFYPTIGGINGGNSLHIHGNGFHKNKTIVFLNESICPLQFVNETYISCRIPSSGIGDALVMVKVGEKYNISQQRFQYALETTPSISAVIPHSSSSLNETEISILGNSFGDVGTLSVMIGSYPCEVLESSASEIKCRLRRVPPETYDIKVSSNIYGDSSIFSKGYQSIFDIHSISPRIGSILGGTVLTISGDGFMDNLEYEIMVGMSKCNVISIEQKVIVCILERPSIQHNLSIETLVTVTSEVLEQKITSNCKVQDNCTFFFDISETPIIMNFSPKKGLPGEVIRIDGRKFGSENEVWIGDSMCLITGSSESQINCSLSEHIATRNQSLVVKVNNLGYAQDTSGEKFEYLGIINSISPQHGSIKGGTHLTIIGNGFGTSVEKVSVMIGGTECKVQNVTTSGVYCTTSEVSESLSTSKIELMINDQQIQCTSVSCVFNYSQPLTPIITGISQDTGRKGDQIVLEGHKLYSSKVYIGKTECQIITNTETNITCIVDNIMAGIHRIIVVVEGVGNADLQIHPFFRSILTIHESSMKGSFAGGTLLQIRGEGLDKSSKVSICGVNCDIITGNYSSVMCKTGRFVNIDSYNRYGWKKEEVIKPKQVFSHIAASLSLENAAFDENIETSFMSTSATRSTCHTGFFIGNGFLAIPTIVDFYPKEDLANGRDLMVGGQFEASQDGYSWDLLLKIDVRPSSGWNRIRINSTTAYSYFRYRGFENSFCTVSEIYFTGIVISSRNNTCNMSVSVGGEEATTGLFEYTHGLTPILQMLSPESGTAAGGTEVILEGEGFLPIYGNAENTSVIINGVQCNILMITDSAISCVTGTRHQFHEDSEIYVQVPGKGYAVQMPTVSYTYIDRWSSPLTWGNQNPPREGESVVIPRGQRILLDVSPPRMVLIVIEGELFFEYGKSLTLDATYVFVRGGKLSIGSEERPYDGNVTITLHGDREETAEIPIYGAKGMSLREGIIDIHGAPRLPSWTQLSMDIQPGDEIMVLSEKVHWIIDDRLVIAPSSFDHNEAEEVIITEVISSNSVRFSPRAKHFHCGTQQYINEISIDTRTEVALLSRNIIFQGDPNSEKQQFGAHLMIHSVGDDSSIARISHTEFRFVGQANNLGRYPIHFHMIGRVDTSYVKHTSIHHSFNRAIAIHGVHYLKLIYNVAYNVMGHNFFIEDGIETNNYFISNLAIKSMPSFSLLNTDTSPASFWITNPKNHFINNHAAGSQNYGFWFDLVDNPTGASATNTICPTSEQLGTFTGNYAHSNGRYGLRVFEKFLPRERPCNPNQSFQSNDAVTAIFDSMVSYKNIRNGAIFTHIGAVEIRNFKVTDNQQAGIEVSIVSAPFGRTKIVNSLINGKSLMIGTPSVSRGIITPRSENFFIQNVTFSNFEVDAIAIETCSKCSVSPVMNQGGYHTYVSQLRFINSPIRAKIGWPFKDILFDMDGSLTGMINASASYLWPHNRYPGCSVNFEVGGLICDSSVTLRRVAIYNVQPDYSLAFKDMIVKTIHGESVIPFLPKSNPNRGWVFTAAMLKTVRLWWDHYVDMTSSRLEYHNLKPSEHLYIQFNHTDFRDHFKVTPGGPNVVETSLLNETLPFGSQAHDNHINASKVVTILVKGPLIETPLSIQTMNIIANRCPESGCPQPPRPLSEPQEGYWSDPSLWSNHPIGHVPSTGDEVFIPNSWTVILDVHTVRLKSLIVDGKVIAESGKSVGIQSDIIWIREGSIVAGNETNPFTGDFVIKLFGMKDSVPLLISNSMNLGPKVLANFGLLALYGTPVTPVFTRLAETAIAGDVSILVDDLVNWANGSEIVIGTTSNRIEESERVIIIGKEFVGPQTRLHIHPPVKFRHHGILHIESTGEIVDNRAFVSVLSRNVRIIGADQEKDFGCHLFTGHYTDNSRLHYGITTLSNVEIKNCGQEDSERFALLFQDLWKSSNISIITNCSMNDNFATALGVIGTSKGVRISNNVVFKTIRSSIQVDLTTSDISLIGNIVITTLPRRQTGIKQEDVLASFFVQGENILRDNIAIGSADMAFIFDGDDCRASSSTLRILNNQAHSSQIGFFIYGLRSNCMKLAKSLANKIFHIGVLSFRRASVFLEDIVIIDSNIGFSLNSALKLRNNTFHVNNLLMIGESSNYESGKECAARYGMFSSTFSSNQKTLPPKPTDLPWYKIKSDPVVYGVAFISNVRFSHWKNPNQRCNGIEDRAISNNPIHPDSFHTHKFSSIVWRDSDPQAKLFIPDPDPAWRNEDDCGNMDCSGPQHVVYQDMDGSLTGIGPYSAYLAHNPGIADRSKCTLIMEYNAFECQNMKMQTLVIESGDLDTYDRNISPVMVKTGEREAYLNAAMDHVWHLDYTGQKRLSTFFPAVEVQRDYQIKFTGTNPKTLNYYLLNADPSDALTITIKYSTPERVRVMDEKFAPYERSDNLPTIQSSNGANSYDFRTRTLYFTIRGPTKLIIQTVPIIQVSMRMETNLENFFADKFVENLAGSLGIDPKLIRIVDVRLGSVIVDFEIEPPIVKLSDTIVNQTSDGQDINEGISETHLQSEAMARATMIQLQTLFEELMEKASNGSLEVGYPVLNITAAVVTDSGGALFDETIQHDYHLLVILSAVLGSLGLLFVAFILLIILGCIAGIALLGRFKQNPLIKKGNIRSPRVIDVPQEKCDIELVRPKSAEWRYDIQSSLANQPDHQNHQFFSGVLPNPTTGTRMNANQYSSNGVAGSHSSQQNGGPLPFTWNYDWKIDENRPKTTSLATQRSLVPPSHTD